MLKSIIRTLLQKFIDDIDADNCNITMEQQSKIISVLSNIANPDQRMSKIQACDYIGVSRTKLISIDGELGSIRFWAIRIGMSHTALNYRLKTYGEDNLISFIKQKLN